VPTYVGRFAPSPTGPLHLGSLVCALASYLDARSRGGRWLLRIEDIDPPREQAGASELIIASLREHGLRWDGDIQWQSRHRPRYVQALKTLDQLGLTYRCSCSRQRLRDLNGVYDGHCLRHPPKYDRPCAIRINVSAALAHLGIEEISFDDRLQGPQREDFSASGDLIVFRRDGLFAYHLAVICDDAADGVSDVVRGCDLLNSSGAQILLLRLLGHPPPRFAHIPMVCDEHGDKLSKQTHAAPLDNQHARANLQMALRALNLGDCPLGLDISRSLAWAVEHWSPHALVRRQKISLASLSAK